MRGSWGAGKRKAERGNCRRRGERKGREEAKGRRRRVKEDDFDPWDFHRFQ